MGIGISSSLKCGSSPYSVNGSNPNPERFEILNEEYKNKYLILLVRYPDCTNYEGKKILVYQGFKTSKALLKHNLFKLDPHFKDDKGAPIARFNINANGMKALGKFINSAWKG